MEKTNLISEFRTRVGEDNLEFISDQTFEAMADLYLPRFADDTKIVDDTWKEPITVLTNFAGQAKSSRMKFAQDFETQNKTKQQKAIDDAVAAAKAQWEKDHAGKGGTGGSGGTGGTGGTGGEGGKGGENTDVANIVTKALEDYNKKLFGEDGKSGLLGTQLNATSEFIKTQTAAQEQAKLASIGKELKDFLTGEKATKDFAINLAVKNIVAGIEKVADADIDALKLKVKKEYESVYKEAYGDGGKPFGGDGTGGGAGGDNSYVKSRIEQLKKEAEDNQNYSKQMEETFC